MIPFQGKRRYPCRVFTIYFEDWKSAQGEMADSVGVVPATQWIRRSLYRTEPQSENNGLV
jgi:hypothetical protein